MADAALLTNYSNFLFELQGSMQQLFAMEYPFLAELSGALADGGYDAGYKRYTKGIAELSGDRETFHGSKVGPSRTTSFCCSTCSYGVDGSNGLWA